MKRYFERQQEEGWRSVGSKFVCTRCFSDYAIANFVKGEASKRTCSYCGRRSGRLIAADMDGVLSFIAAGFNRAYDIPENTLPYDSSEGGWQLREPDDSYDLFMNEGWLNDSSAGYNELHRDLTAAFSDRMFVPNNPLGMSQSERLRYSWTRFCNTVMHETRFVFFKLKRKRQSNLSWDPDGVEDLPPYHILEHLGQVVEDYSLIRDVPRRTILVRARQHPAAERPTGAAHLGSPPREKARQSRMSPAGISMFYGAENEKTAFLETYDHGDPAKDTMTFGKFTTARVLRVLDLTEIPEIPSIFDSSSEEHREELIFLGRFAADVSKPIARDGREHYEYVPTQVVAEYFRSVFKAGRHRLDGVAFKSSRPGAGISYCIFADSRQCSDSFRTRVKPAPFYRSEKRTLVLTKEKRRPIAKCLARFGHP